MPAAPAHWPAAEPRSDPAALLRDLRAHHGALGITRVARQTGLDRIGIPCYAAIRPNSATVATHQGKGIDDLSAEISAVMEAAEYAFAEAPDCAPITTSAAAARAAGLEPVSVAHLMPPGWQPDPDAICDWLEGTLVDGTGRALVPRDAVVIGTPPRDFVGIAQSTNGLAAGTSFDSALLHALTELIERDAVCLWGFRPDAAALASAVAPADFADPAIDRLMQQIAAAGFRLNLFDQTSDIGVPCLYSVLAPADRPDRHFDAATGAGCHPVAAIAARRAIVEAAQTRIAIISGARDDIEAGDYDAALSRGISVLSGPVVPARPPPPGLPAGTGAAELLDFVKARLASVGLGRIVAVPLGGGSLGIHVLKAFVPGLEDRLTNRHWRPGSRAVRAMLGLI